MMTQMLMRRVVSDSWVIRSCQAACFTAAGLIPVLAFDKFAELEISETYLMVGVIATIAMALFYTTLGVLLEPRAKAH